MELLGATTATATDLSYWIMSGAGLFMLAEAVFAWEWTMNTGPLHMLAKPLGRGGARIVYGLIAAAMATWGIVRVSALLAS